VVININREREAINPARLEGVDAVIHLAGETSPPAVGLRRERLEVSTAAKKAHDSLPLNAERMEL